jgi:hypothetical protein
MIQYIKIYSIILKLRMLARCSGLEYFLFMYGSNSYVAAVAYFASEGVLGHGYVSVLYWYQ